MLISESKSFLFVHVQKTAGTSLAEILKPHALNPANGRMNKLASDLGLVRDWRKFHFRKHANLRKAQSVISAPVYDGLFKFAFVRNPWERLVSWYQYVQRTPLHEDCRPGETFADFAARFLEKPRRAQWWMIEDLNGVMGLDYVGRFENLNDDIAYLCQRIGIKAQTLPHRNKMADKDYRTFYDDRLALAVKNNWTREIDAFGYTFEP
ncbi:MAG: sulfotransferase family 2 domain-containing protein [Arenimonas sp.]